MLQGNKLLQGVQEVKKLDELWNRETQQGDNDHKTNQFPANGDTVLSKDETALKQAMRYLNKKDKDNEQLEAVDARNEGNTRLKFVPESFKNKLNTFPKGTLKNNYGVKKMNTKVSEEKPFQEAGQVNGQKGQDNDDTELSKLLENDIFEEEYYQIEVPNNGDIKNFKSMVRVVCNIGIIWTTLTIR